jgi:hypothetical protein
MRSLVPSPTIISGKLKTRRPQSSISRSIYSLISDPGDPLYPEGVIGLGSRDGFTPKVLLRSAANCVSMNTCPPAPVSANAEAVTATPVPRLVTDIGNKRGGPLVKESSLISCISNTISLRVELAPRESSFPQTGPDHPHLR